MPYFSVKALRAKTKEPVKVEFFLGGVSRGFTPNRLGQALVFDVGSSGRYQWYAKQSGRKVAEGSSDGGEILVLLN